jgi:hypothetical protein
MDTNSTKIEGNKIVWNARMVELLSANPETGLYFQRAGLAARLGECNPLVFLFEAVSGESGFSKFIIERSKPVFIQFQALLKTDDILVYRYKSTTKNFTASAPVGLLSQVIEIAESVNSMVDKMNLVIKSSPAVFESVTPSGTDKKARSLDLTALTLLLASEQPEGTDTKQPEGTESKPKKARAKKVPVQSTDAKVEGTESK